MKIPLNPEPRYYDLHDIETTYEEIIQILGLFIGWVATREAGPNTGSQVMKYTSKSYECSLKALEIWVRCPRGWHVSSCIATFQALLFRKGPFRAWQNEDFKIISVSMSCLTQYSALRSGIPSYILELEVL